MAKQPISVTLDPDNLLWLRGQAKVHNVRSLSEALDRLVTGARTRGRGQDAVIRSVVGTIEIDPTDPLLETADEDMRSLFDTSLQRPLIARERPAKYGPSPSSPRRHRRG